MGTGLQLVLDDSERIRLVMQDFRAVLDDICSVCNMSWQKDRLQQSDQQVHKMQRTILEQLELFVQAVQVKQSASGFGHSWMFRVETTLAMKILTCDIYVLGGGGHGRRGEDLGQQRC